jgi:hypothetical protein
MRSSSRRAGAAAMIFGLVLPALATGCGPGAPEVDKSALYTPESLADELAFRYRALKPDARKFSRAAGSASKSAKRAADLDRARQAEKKGGGAEEPKKRDGPPTLDDVMADVESKIDKVQGTPRPDVCRKMIEILSKDASLSEADRKLLTDRLNQTGSP